MCAPLPTPRLEDRARSECYWGARGSGGRYHGSPLYGTRGGAGRELRDCPDLSKQGTQWGGVGNEEKERLRFPGSRLTVGQVMCEC